MKALLNTLYDILRKSRVEWPSDVEEYKDDADEEDED